MIENKYTGFVTSKVNYQESDAIITILTDSGKTSFKARGINKINSKNGPALNYFMISDYVLSSKSELSNKTLKTANIVKVYKSCFDDLTISASYLYICSLLNQVSEQINGYQMALKCFEMLDENIEPLNVLNYFVKELVNALGYKPNLDGCINCHNKNNLISFNLEQGGFICKKCFDNNLYINMPTLFLKDLYLFLKNDDFVQLDKQHALKIFKLYNEFFKDNNLLKTSNYDFLLKCL